MTGNITNTIDDLYDQNGAIIYTIVILLFYSLSLFCSLILNIDPDDYHHEKNWSDHQTNKTQRTLQTNRAEILNTLSNPSLRQKYWRIYYGDEEYDRRSNAFASEEVKRLSIVSQRMKELNNERTNTYEESYRFNRMMSNMTSQSSSSTFFSKLRRHRSTSAPFIILPNIPIRRSFDILSETPLCKPSSEEPL